MQGRRRDSPAGRLPAVPGEQPLRAAPGLGRCSVSHLLPCGIARSRVGTKVKGSNPFVIGVLRKVTKPYESSLPMAFSTLQNCRNIVSSRGTFMGFGSKKVERGPMDHDIPWHRVSRLFQADQCFVLRQVLTASSKVAI